MPADNSTPIMDTIKQKIILLFLFCAGNFFLVQAQPSVKTTVDKNEILIGEQLKVKVEASFEPNAFFVRWIAVPDSLPHFELVGKTTIDSIFNNEKLTGLVQTFTLTSFDSGKWSLPSFNIKFNPAKGDSTLNFFSDPFPVTVAFQKDTVSGLRDIKAIREVKIENDLFWCWILSGAALLLVLVIIWWYMRREKGKPVIPRRSPIPPYRFAMNELEKLKQLSLSVPAEIKAYHSRLAEIFKQYLSAKTMMDLGSKTTGEILILLKDNDIDKEQLSKTSTALRSSDVVKFAKYLPAPVESEASLQSIKQLIDIIEQSNIKTKQY